LRRRGLFPRRRHQQRAHCRELDQLQLPRAIGSSRAFEIMLSGRDVGAEEAERIHRVTCARRPLDTGSRWPTIAGYSHLGVELTKQLLWAGLDAGGCTA
jgi:enoyl-CoA hydratase